MLWSFPRHSAALARPARRQQTRLTARRLAGPDYEDYLLKRRQRQDNVGY